MILQVDYFDTSQQAGFTFGEIFFSCVPYANAEYGA